MKEERWQVLTQVSGQAQAEILGGLLEAQGIRVYISQEGVGHYAYAATVGKLGEVDLLVPEHQLEEARQVLADYQAGRFEQSEEDDRA